MILDLEPQGEWFTFFESKVNARGEVEYLDQKPDAGRVCLRSIGPVLEKIRARKKKIFEFVLNSSTRSMERVGYYPELTPKEDQAEREEIWDYMITGLENFFDGKGQAITCTKENKVRLMSLPLFDRFVARCLQVLASAGVKAQEEAEKN